MEEVATSAPPADGPAQSVTDHALGWFSSAKSRAGAVTDLAVAEARLAVMSVALMIFLAVMAAICVLSAWGLALAGVAYLLSSAGLPFWAVLLILVIPLGVAAVLLCRAAMKTSRNLAFTATREQLGRAELAVASESSA